MSKETIYDKDMRPALREYLLKRYPEERGKCIHKEEMNLAVAYKDYCRADYIIVQEDMMIGIEIKSSADSLDRLHKQQWKYRGVCNSFVVCTTQKHVDYLNKYFSHMKGLLLVKDRAINVAIKKEKLIDSIECLAEEKIFDDEHLSPDALAGMLLKPEALAYIHRYSKNRRWSRFQSDRLRKIIGMYLAEEHGIPPLAKYVRQCIIKRNTLPEQSK